MKWETYFNFRDLVKFGFFVKFSFNTTLLSFYWRFRGDLNLDRLTGLIEVFCHLCCLGLRLEVSFYMLLELYLSLALYFDEQLDVLAPNNLGRLLPDFVNLRYNILGGMLIKIIFQLLHGNFQNSKVCLHRQV